MNDKLTEPRHLKNYRRETQKWGIKKHSGAKFEEKKKA